MIHSKIAMDYARTDLQISATFNVMRQLRPHLDETGYVESIRGLMASDGLRMLSLTVDSKVHAVATFRVMNMLYCGRLLYVDDLVADAQTRSQGYGACLMARIKEEGRTLGCSEVQLISRVTREQAHRFYFREGFGIECFHFRARLA